MYDAFQYFTRLAALVVEEPDRPASPDRAAIEGAAVGGDVTEVPTQKPGWFEVLWSRARGTHRQSRPDGARDLVSVAGSAGAGSRPRSAH